MNYFFLSNTLFSTFLYFFPPRTFVCICIFFTSVSFSLVNFTSFIFKHHKKYTGPDNLDYQGPLRVGAPGLLQLLNNPVMSKLYKFIWNIFKYNSKKQKKKTVKGFHSMLFVLNIVMFFIVIASIVNLREGFTFLCDFAQKKYVQKIQWKWKIKIKVIITKFCRLDIFSGSLTLTLNKTGCKRQKTLFFYSQVRFSFNGWLYLCQTHFFQHFVCWMSMKNMRGDPKISRSHRQYGSKVW